jgi:hypothetical protein
MNSWFVRGAVVALAVLSPTLASAQAGVWQCEYGTRNVHRQDAHAVAYQAIFNVYQNGYVEAQGVMATGEQFYGEGQWSLSNDGGNYAFSIRGQRTDAILGTALLVFDSNMTSEYSMLLNVTFPTGDIVASSCQRTQ